MNRGELLRRLHDPRPLTAEDSHATFDALVDPNTDEEARVGILAALSARDIRPLELAAFAVEMQRRAIPFQIPVADHAIDLCGSGGARTPSYNVSTVSAFVVAAAGVPVVKHGNRSSRGLCGSSDLLEALGLPVTESIPFARATYRAHHLAFLHAPLFHPATRAVAAARKALGTPTVFNQLGPLSNPARISYQLVGVADVPTATRAAQVLGRLGRRRASAISSVEGCDEFSPKRETYAVLWSSGRLGRRTIRASDLLPPEDRRGSWSSLPPAQAAEEAERILAGGGGARRGSVLLTAGAALWVARAVRSIPVGVDRAREALDSGRAERLFRSLLVLARDHRASGGV